MTPLEAAPPIARVEVEDSTQVPIARSAAIDAAREAGADSAAVDRIALAATELAQNLHRYAVGGELIVIAPQGNDRVTLVALDRGPGVVDFQRCLVDGYTTGGTMGTGLGAIQRLATEFDAMSEFGVGTAVAASFAVRTASPSEPDDFDVAAVGFPIGGEEVNGDTYAHRRDSSRLQVLLADGLGHGPLAADASRAAAAQLRTRSEGGPEELMRRLNLDLTRTRGAAVSIAELDLIAAREGGHLLSCGLGNVSLLTAAPDGTTKRIVTSHGTAGAKLTMRVSEQVTPFPAQGALILHTDGLATRWDLSGRAELLRHSAVLIASVLWRDFARGTDDSMVVVARARVAGTR